MLETMAEIVNLRQARKAKKRAEKSAKAAENRVRFGRTKTQSREEARDRMAKKTEIDGKKLD